MFRHSKRVAGTNRRPDEDPPPDRTDEQAKTSYLLNMYMDWRLAYLYVAGRPCHSSGSCRLLSTTARVRSQVKSCGICGEQSVTGAGFLRILRFPLSIFITPTAPHSSSSGAGTIGQLVAVVPSGLSLTPPQEELCVRLLHGYS
jgi:hypothetical protein